MHIGILGGGPAAVWIYKRIAEEAIAGTEVSIFEKDDKPGAGMPYSKQGALPEHITNVSDNEIPYLVCSVEDWLPNAPAEVLTQFDMQDAQLNEYKVLPRLLFGAYLHGQFRLLQDIARKNKIITHVHTHTSVTDIKLNEPGKGVTISTDKHENNVFDKVVICTGHHWPAPQEAKTANWFDSPYPPTKLAKSFSGSVAIKGASLTAIDALRTLAANNGSYTKNNDGTYKYVLNEASKGFNITLHSLHGLLPALRFHLADTHLTPVPVLTPSEMQEVKTENGGFIPLDYLYQRHFIDVLKKQSPLWYDKVKDLSLEEFIEGMLHKREDIDPFQLFKAEYKEAEKSIRRQESIPWKEALGALSYAINYPAKHMSAEDMLRVKKVLMPLVSIIIAYVPQSSAREMMALHDAGVLTMKAVTTKSKAEPNENGGCTYFYEDENGNKSSQTFDMYVNATGQAPLLYNQIPFESLKESNTISPAYILYQSEAAGKSDIENGNTQAKLNANGQPVLELPGIMINDQFSVLDIYGRASQEIFVMAVPFIAGINPDYSGLDFCEKASKEIIKPLLAQN